MLIPLLKLVACFSITDNIVSIVKLFPDDTSIFSAVNYANISADELNVVRCAIQQHLYSFKNVKNTDGGVLILVKLQVNTPPWVFFTFFKLYKCYQIAQRTTNKDLQKVSEWFYRWKMSFNPDLRSDFLQKTKQIKSPKNLF